MGARAIFYRSRTGQAERNQLTEWDRIAEMLGY
jgi:hypothetical protein